MLKIQAVESFQFDPPGFQELAKNEIMTLYAKYQHELAARQQAIPPAPQPPPVSFFDDGQGMAARTPRATRLTASAPEPSLSYDPFNMSELYGTLEVTAAPVAAPPRPVQPSPQQAAAAPSLAQQAPVGFNPALVKEISIQTLRQYATALETYKDVERYTEDYRSMMDPELNNLVLRIKMHEYLQAQIKSKIIKDFLVILEFGGVNVANFRTDHDKKLDEDATYRQIVLSALAAAPEVLNHLLDKARSNSDAPTEQTILADSMKASVRFVHTHQPRPVQPAFPNRSCIHGAAARTKEWLGTMGIAQSPEETSRMIEALNVSLGGEPESQINGYTAQQLLVLLAQTGQHTREESDGRMQDLIVRYHSLSSTMLKNGKQALQDEYAKLHLVNQESVNAIIKMTLYGMFMGRTVPIPLPTPIIALLFDKYPAFAQFTTRLSALFTDEITATRKTRKRISAITHAIYSICQLYGLKDDFRLTTELHPRLEPTVYEFMAIVQSNFTKANIDVSQLLGFFDCNYFECPILSNIVACPVVVPNKIDRLRVFNGLEFPHAALMDADSTVSLLRGNHARGAMYRQQGVHPISQKLFVKDDVYRPSPALSALVVAAKVIKKIRPLTSALPPELRDIEVYGARTYRETAEVRARTGLPELPVIQAAGM